MLLHTHLTSQMAEVGYVHTECTLSHTSLGKPSAQKTHAIYPFARRTSDFIQISQWAS